MSEEELFTEWVGTGYDAYKINYKKEYERLNNIINELENELYKFYAYEGYNDEQIKDKIKELKGADKE